jgi:hypothetical protein
VAVLNQERRRKQAPVQLLMDMVTASFLSLVGGENVIWFWGVGNMQMVDRLVVIAHLTLRPTSPLFILIM